MVRDVNTKGILKKSPVESINFYIIISPEGDFIIGLDNPDYELMSYNDPNPVTGFANMYIFAGGVYPVDWTVATPTIEDCEFVACSVCINHRDQFHRALLTMEFLP